MANSKFPTMGTSASNAINVSGAPSKNTKCVPRKNTQAGPVPGQKVNRKNVLERNGFKGAPQMTHAYPQPSGDTCRNVRILPSAVGAKPFYDGRADNNEGSVAPVAQRYPNGSWPVLRKLG